ncbi:MAG: 30S ribosomal protein S5 [Clostridiales bacterium]|nr:30S ribosomal protein S5 [Clostridiales bacterium]
MARSNNFKRVKQDYKDKVVEIKRVTKVVKGGRNFSFAALVVIGDEAGRVGYGLGKASEVIEAIRKGKEKAKKNILFVERNYNNSVFHSIIGRHGSAKVIVMPASDGTGVIAGGPSRIVMELAGIKNIRTKNTGSNNKRNVINATFDALKNLLTPKSVAYSREKSIREILGKNKNNVNITS